MKYCADPEWSETPVESLLSDEYGSNLSKRIDPHKLEKSPLGEGI